ncbi:zinc-binding metallopeptidase family protein [Notoacmeibacter ruber]|uniref:Zinc-ribbon domain-containing protein n=1 Tax=Notoacmeibacter ruber TaxID=2670375 RepID=A0A3L7JIS8_9HYPH|nr:putative zinc-binding peptidase [Notoacmeibacter ruber]RLQ88392.1 hypothetical protein D8780_09440 [Notoacmeibacter ruber]
MKRFYCSSCDEEVYFDNHFCGHCDRRLGFDPATTQMVALEDDGNGAWHAIGTADGTFRLCRNHSTAACNWLIDATTDHERCTCCQHNRTIPDLSVEGNQEKWTALETGKRALFYSIRRWGLPHPVPGDAVAEPLVFDFLSDEELPDGTVNRVLTGHDEGLITINIAEGDDAIREANRKAMGEPYRTLIGHFRHEVGHYYWDILVRDGNRLDAFRELFGDERADYGEALQKHYENGAPADWADHYISSYATAHPWEDFAETWAHYLHMTDTIETARAYGLVTAATEAISGEQAAVHDVRSGYDAASAAALVESWVPVTIAANAINRSMGQPDLYPFVLNKAVMRKLAFMHDLVHESAG